jgi:glucosamine-6-phosphate deaminase
MIERLTGAGHVRVYETGRAASVAAADWIVRAVEISRRERGRAVVGLATGGTPVGVYGELVQRYRTWSLSFRDVETFNLDEYYPMSPCDRRSYRYYMQEKLFDHIDIEPNRTHVLDGTVPEWAVAEEGARFERWMEEAGGLDVQLLGIGRNGHIGFNEPMEVPVSEAVVLPTRLAELDAMTREDAAREFGGDVGRVPARALTVGTRAILGARLIVMLALGERKAGIVARAVEGPATARVPASLLQTVSERVVWVLDEAAAAELSWMK